jgi:hypothetical protein
MKTITSLALTAVLSGLLPVASAQENLLLGSGENDLGRYADYGFNAFVAGDLTGLATFSAIAPGVLPEGSDALRDIAHARRILRERCREAAPRKLAVVLMTDELKFPTPVWEQLLRQAPEATASNRLNLESEALWTLYRAKYREVLQAFPEVAYVMVRTGENYAHLGKGYSGQTIRGQRLDDAYFRNMQRLINETRKIVVEEFGRKLIWRTWDLGNDGFHANPAVYDRVLAGVTERKGLIVSVKHTQTDFWEYNDFNPTIGRGGVEQLVEFQCAREYEGKGAFPYYLGAQFADDIRHARTLGANGVWVWNFGGGWGGPELKNDRWVRANIDAAIRLARNPSLPAQDLARQWAAKEFGPKAAPKVAAMLELSRECVRKMMYVEPYALRHKGWLPSRNLLRDDLIRGERRVGDEGGLRLIYDEAKSSFAAALREKIEAQALAKRMRKLLEEAKADIVAERDERTYQEAHTSLLHLEALSDVMRHYVCGMFLFYRSEETHDASTAAQARTELLQWRAAWNIYNQEISKLPGAATLYRSLNTQSENSTAGAMADTCERALKALP